ncbi:FtsB family cell division protein [Actinocrispum wychmicini]|uniref:Cell division protein FtsB n=1 Tax=Actinocrispum wychmicini TaxID=1213861 RepID=A0A4R2JHA8_9PSEU|nr:septum formation initiator family protein [Actinocrispum wychmicini]TCO58444.1 cell division protein FtsB [Actinocrispum wychmicini]
MSETSDDRPERASRRRPAPRRRWFTRGWFGISTTRRAAVVATVVCALALSIAVPLRTYLSQRDDVAAQEKRQAELRAQVQELEERKAQLSDPAQIQAEARRRLRYVMPGETPYMVQLPGDNGMQSSRQTPQAPGPQQPWFQNLWDSVIGSR